MERHSRLAGGSPLAASADLLPKRFRLSDFRLLHGIASDDSAGATSFSGVHATNQRERAKSPFFAHVAEG